MISDMIPGHVADLIKRKHARENARHSSAPGAPITDHSAEIFLLPSAYITATSDCIVVDSDNAASHNIGHAESASSEDDRNVSSQALVYKQWHPAVSILFADIVGFTTLSKEVEPEQVMLMLHGEERM